MVPLADLLNHLSRDANQSNSVATMVERSTRCLSLEQQLMALRDGLSPGFEETRRSLAEPEYVKKQRTVVKLRKWLLRCNEPYHADHKARLLQRPNTPAPTISHRCSVRIRPDDILGTCPAMCGSVKGDHRSSVRYLHASTIFSQLVS